MTNTINQKNNRKGIDKSLFGLNDDCIQQSSPLRDFSKILVLRNQFFYITHVVPFSNIFVSSNITLVLGYDPEDFYDLDFVYGCVHPEDFTFVIEFSKKTLEYGKICKDLLLRDPFCAVFSIEFRMRHKNGEYIRVNRQTSCYEVDKLGDIVLTISMFTEVRNERRPQCILYDWKVPEEISFSIDGLVSKYKRNYFSKREFEVLQSLSKGLNAGEIALKLFISEYTVISHRKNLLRKTKCRNTPELIRYAQEKGLL